MNKKNAAVNFGIVVSMLFCMAFACNDGDKQGGATDGETTQPTRKTTAGDALTEQDVKEYFADWYAHSSVPSTFTYDSPIQIAPMTRHTFGDGSTYDCYPVKVDLTATTDLGNSYKTTHFTHAIYYFYRNSFGEWEMSGEGSRSTEEYRQK